MVLSASNLNILAHLHVHGLFAPRTHTLKKHDMHCPTKHNINTTLAKTLQKQDPMLFGVSILENIAMGWPEFNRRVGADAHDNTVL